MEQDDDIAKLNESLGELLVAPEVRQLLQQAGLEINVKRSQESIPLEGGLSWSAAKQQLQELAEQRESRQHMARVGELGAGVVHEVRNILTGVLGLAQVGAVRLQDAQATKLLSMIEVEARRCIDMLASYLNYSHLRRGDAIPVELRECLEHVAKLVSNQLRVNHCQLIYNVDPATPTVIARPGELQQVLVNLIVNAAQASGPAGVVQIDVGPVSATEVEISVTDTGAGVPEDMRDRIFEPFFTTKSAGVGTGLGLPISLRIVELHGGTLTVAGGSNGGAKFVIRIPVDCRDCLEEV